MPLVINSMLKFIRKLFVGLLLTLTITILATGAYCYHYQDQIIQLFLRQAKKQLKNPLHIGSIQLTALRNFPHIGLRLQEVVVKDRTKATEDLMAVREVYCALDVWKLLHGQYVVSHLSLTHGKFYWGQDAAHQLEWEQGQQPAQQTSLAISLDEIELKDMKIVYGGQQHYEMNASQMRARLIWAHNRLGVDLQGKATIHNIQLAELVFAQDLPLSVRARLSYDQVKKIWELSPMQLGYGESKLTVQGTWSLEKQYPTALQIRGKQVTPHLLLRCLPPSYCQQLRPYDLRGQLNLRGSINKSKSRKWALQGNFELKKGGLIARQTTKPIVFDKLVGALNMPNLHDLSTASLSIKEMNSTLGQSKLVGNCIVKNFDDPHLQCVAEGTFDLASLSPLIANNALVDTSGKVALQGKLSANLRQLRHGLHAKDNLSLVGGLQAQNVQFKVGPGQLLCRGLTGSLVFKDNEWIIKEMAGSLGPGSLVLSGSLQNLLPYLLSDKEQCRVDAKLHMDYLDLDLLLGGEPNTGTTPAFNITPRWAMGLSCDIQQLHFRRFQGKNVRGQLKVKDQKLTAETLQLGIAGGKASLNGVLDASDDHLSIDTSTRLQGVQVNKLFYMFENFHQTFLMDRHLNGEVFSDFNLRIQTDKRWKIQKETIQADINVRLHNGALCNFEPIQKLAKYVDSESLAKLHFSELKNHIFIKDQTVYIPPMGVHSNITYIQVSGTHAFDGKVDYNFVVPFTRLGGREIPEEVGEDALGGINLFLKLQGDVDDYKLSYDATELGNSLNKKLGEQGAVIKKLFQGKYQEKAKLQELAPDDYFEFE